LCFVAAHSHLRSNLVRQPVSRPLGPALSRSPSDDAVTLSASSFNRPKHANLQPLAAGSSRLPFARPLPGAIQRVSQAPACIPVQMEPFPRSLPKQLFYRWSIPARIRLTLFNRIFWGTLKSPSLSPSCSSSPPRHTFFKRTLPEHQRRIVAFSIMPSNRAHLTPSHLSAIAAPPWFTAKAAAARPLAAMRCGPSCAQES
jgi:hypothetical protein